MTVTTLKKRSTLKAAHDADPACETTAALRKLAVIHRDQDELHDDETRTDEWQRLNSQAKAVLNAAAYTLPSSPLGMAFLSICNYVNADTWDDFTDSPELPSDLQRQNDQRRHARLAIAELLVIRNCFGIDDPDLAAVRLRYCVGRSAMQ